MSQTSEITALSPLHLVDLVHAAYPPVAVGAERNGHRRRRIAASSASSRLVRTIAPTIAARRSTEAISNGKAKSVKTLVASAGRSPPPGRGGAPVNENENSATGIATAATNTAAIGVCRWKKSARGRSLNFVNMTPYRISTVIAPT